MTTIITKSPHDWQQLYDTVRRLKNGTVYKVVIEQDDGRKRTLDQNAAKEKLYMEVSKHLGESKVDVMCYCKYNFGLPLLFLRDREDTVRQMLDAFLRKLDFKSLPMLQKLRMCEKLPITSLMTKKELSAYIDMIIQHYNSNGVNVSLER